MSHTRNKKWKCLDCGTDTKHEHYFVNLVLWMNAVGSKTGMLCVGCLETRIGRKLNKSDFTNCTINDVKFGQKSMRLIDRIKN